MNCNHFFGVKFIFILTILFLTTINCKSDKAEKKITLTMYNNRDVTAPDAGNWNQEIERFKALNPNIKLIIEEAFNDPYHQKLQAMTVSGELPDLVYLWPGKRTGYVTERGVIKDLRPWIKGHESEFRSIAMTPQGPNGEIYELPATVTVCHVMYANQKLMKELDLTFPKDFDELVAQGEKIRKAGLIPIAMSNKDGWEMQSCLLSTLTERAGGIDWWNNAVKGNGADFADVEFIHALNVIKKLYDNEMFSPGINQAEYEQSMNDFVNNRAVYYIDGDWKVQELVISMTSEQKEYITMHAFPDIPGQKGKSGSVAAVSGAGFGMNAKLSGEKADAAWSWIWYYSGPEGSKLHQSFGIPVAYKLAPPDDLDILVKKMLSFTTGSPMGPVIDNVMDAEGVEDILNVGLQTMMFGQMTPKETAIKYETWVSGNDSNRVTLR